MQYQQVPTDQIVLDPNNPRQAFAAEKFEELTQSISARGIIVPLFGFSKKSDIQLIDGHCRLAVAQALKLDKIPMVVWDKEPNSSDILLTQLTINCQRTDLSPLELLEAFEKILELNQWNQKQLSQSLGWSKSKTCKTLSLNRLTPQERAFIKQHQIGETKAYQLSRMKPEQRQAALAAIQDRINRENQNDTDVKVVKASKPVTDFVCEMPQASIRVQANQPLTWDLVQQLLQQMSRLCRKAEKDNLDLATAKQVFRDQARASSQPLQQAS